MDIKDIDSQKDIFRIYTDGYIKNATEEKEKEGYIDKQNHSLFVLDEAMLTDALFTNYNESFKKLLALESLFHDIGRFEQMRATRTFNDKELTSFDPLMMDHGDLGAEIIKQDGLLDQLIPNVRIYDEEVRKVIRAHAKINPGLLNYIMLDYIDAFKNYDLSELFSSDKSSTEKKVLAATNTAIVQDVDRLDIFRKIVKGIWVPMVTEDKIDPQVWKWFEEGKLPSMNEIKSLGLWNPNVGHLVRLSFIDQMNLVPVLKQIRDENLIQKVYEANGNEVVKEAYEFAQDKLDRIIDSSDDVIVKKSR